MEGFWWEVEHGIASLSMGSGKDCGGESKLATGTYSSMYNTFGFYLACICI